MNLYFLRHGKAFARSPKWRPDSKRPLTREGEERMDEVARGLRRLDCSFDLILTSPYVRALRTAEILAEVYDARKKLFETANLRAEAHPSAVIGEINENFNSISDIVLVSHEPLMTRILSLLLSGSEAMAIDLKKSGCCKVSVEKLTAGKCACLHWLLTSRQIAALK